MSLCLADTHAHLADDALRPIVDEVVERAASAGVSRILAIGTDLATSRECVRIAERFPGVFAAVGIHPHQADEAASDLAEIGRLAEHPKVMAIGEIGLDYYRQRTATEIQVAAFAAQLALAAKRGLPVVVHNREADRDVMRYIADVRRPPRLADRAGVLHCFVGSTQLAQEARRLGFRISFAGNLTYKKSVGIRNVATEIPLEWILVETDSPYLSPEGRRGRTNSPEHVTLVARQLAETRRTTLDLIAAGTSANARELFAWA